jgi:hypothetical protein
LEDYTVYGSSGKPGGSLERGEYNKPTATYLGTISEFTDAKKLV